MRHWGRFFEFLQGLGASGREGQLLPGLLRRRSAGCDFNPKEGRRSSLATNRLADGLMNYTSKGKSDVFPMNEAVREALETLGPKPGGPAFLTPPTSPSDGGGNG